MNPFRKICGLPESHLKPKYPVNFSGEWMLNEDERQSNGLVNSPYKMVIEQEDDLVNIKKFTIVEWGDDRIMNEEILLDDSEKVSEFFNSPRISTANYDNDNQSILISTIMKFNRNG